MLSEESFTSDEIAKVRLEAPARSGGLAAYSGVDITIYQIPKPIEFLKKQRNLHRPTIPGIYEGEGAGNAIHFLWDVWYKESRITMQKVFQEKVRVHATGKVPSLKQTDPYSYHSNFAHNSQYKKLAKYPVIGQFRYPIWKAKPIQPPKNTKLKGSNITKAKIGNVYIPIGKRKAGLYIVEAVIGKYRASTLVFVSDTVAITKISGNQQFIWTVKKKTGKPSPNTKIMMSDGIGVIQKGVTNQKGVLTTIRKSLEKSYFFGEDKNGGVFISENFYYDSELHKTKMYVFTDRPIYQPGEKVFVKILGRKFENSKESRRLKGGSVKLSVLDPNGTPLIVKTLKLNTATGADTKFTLPKHAGSGGYTLYLNYADQKYIASFRVANFAKPHFELEVIPSKKVFRTGESITGKIRLSYSNGDPVKGAKVEFKARSQKLTVVEGEIKYLGLFPVQLKHQVSTSSEQGTIDFELPATKDPSRYVLRVRASDGSSYRVTSIKELLIHEGFSFYSLSSKNNFSKVGEKISFNMKSHSITETTSKSAKPSHWEAIRLQDQSKLSGKISKASFQIAFKVAGTYSIYLKDKNGNVLGNKSHWVQGSALKAVAGSIQIVLDKKSYQIGDTAKALVTFSEPVQSALVTLERDQVAKHGLLSEKVSWLSMKKLSKRQWIATIPIKEEYSPNITLSFVYVKNGKYIFQNKGIKVDIPQVQITFKTKKRKYLPGERVAVRMKSTLKGKPVRAWVTVSVVDEMIYVLQPEIAPNITDFFYHRRRNQVKTSSSLNFHTFDVATSAMAFNSFSSHRYRERPLKFREGARKEDINTALWLPTLRTDKNGEVVFYFTMPQSITRWRMTARAITNDGQVGQRKQFLSTEKPVFLKWTGSKIFRNGDKPKTILIAYNSTNQSKQVRFAVDGMGTKFGKDILLKTGSNFLELPFQATATGNINASLLLNGKVLDEIQTKITVVPRRWKSTISSSVPILQNKAEIPIPKEAFNVRLNFSQNSSDQFLRVLDNLIEYPYGCVEQTASRLIPLSMAYQRIEEFGLSSKIRDQLQSQITIDRLRLVQMAGANAVFGWWGDQAKGSVFLTSYAYYADWHASKALGIKLPDSHWKKLLELYHKAGTESALNRSLILWLMTEMGLPTRTLIDGELDRFTFTDHIKGSDQYQDGNSYILEESASITSKKVGALLLYILAKKKELDVSKYLEGVSKSILDSFKKESKNPLIQAIVLLAKSKSSKLTEDDQKTVYELLQKVSVQSATIDRTVVLLFLNKAIGFKAKAKGLKVKLPKQWTKIGDHLGRPVWQLRNRETQKVQFQVKTLPKKLHANLLYDTYQKEESKLKVQIRRRLYKLVRVDSEHEYQAIPVSKWEVNSKDLYIDETSVIPVYGSSFKYGLLEIPIPAGADLELPTHGMSIQTKGGRTISVSEVLYHTGDQSYGIPIEELRRPVVIRQLVRFSQKGSFVVPRTRFYRMYLPTEKAFEKEGRRVIVQ